MCAMSHLFSPETDKALLCKPHVHVAQQGEIFFPMQALELAKACFLALFHVYCTAQHCDSMIYHGEFLL